MCRGQGSWPLHTQALCTKTACRTVGSVPSKECQRRLGDFCLTKCPFLELPWPGRWMKSTDTLWRLGVVVAPTSPPWPQIHTPNTCMCVRTYSSQKDWGHNTTKEGWTRCITLDMKKDDHSRLQLETTPTCTCTCTPVHAHAHQFMNMQIMTSSCHNPLLRTLLARDFKGWRFLLMNQKMCRMKIKM